MQSNLMSTFLAREETKCMNNDVNELRIEYRAMPNVQIFASFVL